MCKTVHNGEGTTSYFLPGGTYRPSTMSTLDSVRQFNPAQPRSNQHYRKYVLNLTFEFENSSIAIHLE